MTTPSSDEYRILSAKALTEEIVSDVEDKFTAYGRKQGVGLSLFEKRRRRDRARGKAKPGAKRGLLMRRDEDGKIRLVRAEGGAEAEAPAAVAAETAAAAIAEVSKPRTRANPYFELGTAIGTPEISGMLLSSLRTLIGAHGKVVALPGLDPIVQGAVIDVLERVPAIVHARRDKLNEANIEALVDAYLQSEPTAAARHALAHDNARARAQLLEEIDVLTSKQVAELAGHRAGNTSATAARWKKANKVFALPWKGSDLFPAFQFRDGAPLPVIAQVLAVLPDLSAWQTAFWFTSSNSWLDGATPVDLLGEEDRVVTAAQRESEAPFG